MTNPHSLNRRMLLLEREDAISESEYATYKDLLDAATLLNALYGVLGQVLESTGYELDAEQEEIDCAAQAVLEKLK